MTRRQPIPTDMEDGFGGDGVCYSLYLHLLLKATNVKRKVPTRRGLIELDIGQVRFSPTVFSRYFGNGKAGISAKTVLRHFHKLSQTFHKIDYTLSSIGYIVTIRDYLDIITMEKEDVPNSSTTSPGHSGDKSTKKRVNKIAKKKKVIGRKTSKPPISSLDEFNTLLDDNTRAELSKKHPRIDISIEIERCWNRKTEKGTLIKDARATLSNRLLKADEFKKEGDQKEAGYWRDLGGPAYWDYVTTLSPDTTERLKKQTKTTISKVGPGSITLERLKTWVFYIENPEELKKVQAQRKAEEQPKKPDLTPEQLEENKKKAAELRTKLTGKFGSVIKQ